MSNEGNSQNYVDPLEKHVQALSLNELRILSTNGTSEEQKAVKKELSIRGKRGAENKAVQAKKNKGEAGKEGSWDEIRPTIAIMTKKMTRMEQIMEEDKIEDPISDLEEQIKNGNSAQAEAAKKALEIVLEQKAEREKKEQNS